MRPMSLFDTWNGLFAKKKAAEGRGRPPRATESAANSARDEHARKYFETCRFVRVTGKRLTFCAALLEKLDVS